MASCGGILRNHLGEWIGGYMKIIGECSIVEAEAWGILLGLRVAASKGGGKVIVESDAKNVVDCLKGTKVMSGNCQTLISACKREMENFDKVDIIHILREKNKAADAISKLNQGNSKEIRIFESPPLAIVTCLQNDLHGIPCRRERESHIGFPV